MNSSNLLAIAVVSGLSSSRCDEPICDELGTLGFITPPGESEVMVHVLMSQGGKVSWFIDEVSSQRSCRSGCTMSADREWEEI